MTLVSLCNGSGNVVLEQIGSTKRLVLAATLENFLDALRPTLENNKITVFRVRDISHNL